MWAISSQQTSCHLPPATMQLPHKLYWIPACPFVITYYFAAQHVAAVMATACKQTKSECSSQRGQIRRACNMLCVGVCVCVCVWKKNTNSKVHTHTHSKRIICFRQLLLCLHSFFLSLFALCNIQRPLSAVRVSTTATCLYTHTHTHTHICIYMYAQHE